MAHPTHPGEHLDDEDPQQTEDDAETHPREHRGNDRRQEHFPVELPRRRAERPRHGHERVVHVAHGAHDEDHDREKAVQRAVEHRRRRAVAEQEDDPREHQDLRDAVERDHVGRQDVAQESDRADRDSGRDAEHHRKDVRQGRLAESVGEPGEGVATDPAKGGGDGARRRDEERVDPARPRGDLPHREPGDDGHELEDPDPHSVHRRARCSRRLASTSEPTTRVKVTSTRAT